MPRRLEAALAAVDPFLGLSPDESRALMAAKCRGLVAGYHARWADADYLPVAVERVVQSDLWNPDTGRKSRSFTVAGKIDVSAVFRDRVVPMDHKTTSEASAIRTHPTSGNSSSRVSPAITCCSNG